MSLGCGYPVLLMRLHNQAASASPLSPRIHNPAGTASDVRLDRCVHHRRASAITPAKTMCCMRVPGDLAEGAVKAQSASPRSRSIQVPACSPH
eukprot:2866010-Prymnesium_polylepis.1